MDAQTLKVLEIIRSPYYQPFQQLVEKLQLQHQVAKGNVQFLAALRPYLDALNSSEFEEVGAKIQPVMHVLLMIWKHSPFYNQPSGVHCDDATNASEYKASLSL